MAKQQVKPVRGAKQAHVGPLIEYACPHCKQLVVTEGQYQSDDGLSWWVELHGGATLARPHPGDASKVKCKCGLSIVLLKAGME